ncbi:barstar family protein [bacterium]|nr:barstar family protein [bacterium]
MNLIHFVDDPVSYNRSDAYVAHISSVKGTEQLMSALSEKLRFPDYFGRNWDALDECLRDFWWIENRSIVLVHNEIPDLDKNALLIYIEVLVRAVLDWRDDSDHDFEVVFPASDEYQVRRLIDLTGRIPEGGI